MNGPLYGPLYGPLCELLYGLYGYAQTKTNSCRIYQRRLINLIIGAILLGILLGTSGDCDTPIRLWLWVMFGICVGNGVYLLILGILHREYSFFILIIKILS
jgi:hypothetical protein